MVGFLQPLRLIPGARGYCVYSGRELPRAQLSREHVIPKSLGGNGSTTIWVCQKLNNDFGSRIDGKIAKDPLVSFGRRDANSKGHNNFIETPVFRNAVRWSSNEPLGGGEGSYNLYFPASGPTAFDNRARKDVTRGAFDQTPYVVWNLPIDHVARLKFTLKTLLGLGWLFFQRGILDALDVNLVRRVLISAVSLKKGIREGGLSFTDGLLDVSADERAQTELLKGAFISKSKTSILLRQEDGKLNWSVACVGHFVGSAWLPLKADLLEGKLEAGDGLRITFADSSFVEEVVPRAKLVS